MFSKYNLPNQLKDEKIIKIIRKDIFILFTKVLFFLVLFILPLIFVFIFLVGNENLQLSPLFSPLMILGISAYYLFIWLFFFFSFIDYYLDVWIITNERIIDIEQRGFFSRVISEHKIFRIQDVTSEVHGLFHTLLKYGNVYVQTAGTKQRFQFRDIPEPNRTRDMIIKLVERKKRAIRQEESEDAKA